MSDIIELIADAPAARKQLKPQMSQLQRFADDAYDKVTAIDKRFDEWVSDRRSPCHRDWLVIVSSWLNRLGKRHTLTSADHYRVVLREVLLARAENYGPIALLTNIY